MALMIDKRVRQRCAILAPGAADRKHHVSATPRRIASPLHASLSFRYTQGSGLECLDIGEDVRDLIGIKPELGHCRMGGHDSLREAAAQAFDWEFLMKSSERRRDCERTLADFVDGMALRAMHAHECQTSLRCRRLGEDGITRQ